jgi:hypothetical protein
VLDWRSDRRGNGFGAGGVHWLVLHVPSHVLVSTASSLEVQKSTAPHSIAKLQGIAQNAAQRTAHRRVHGTARHGTAQHEQHTQLHTKVWIIDSTVQRSSGQHVTAQNNTAEHSIAHHNTAQRNTTQRNTSRHRIAHHSTEQHSTGLPS